MNRPGVYGLKECDAGSEGDADTEEIQNHQR